MRRPLLLALLALAAPLAAAEAAKPPVAAPADAAVDPVPPLAVNRRCPVTGDPVDRNVPVQVVDLVRDGKTTRVAVGLCCEDCIQDLEREPQRFAAAALENRKAPKPGK